MWRDRHVKPSSATTEASCLLYKQLLARVRKHPAGSRECSTLKAVAILVSPLYFRLAIVWRHVMQFVHRRSERDNLLHALEQGGQPKPAQLCGEPLLWVPR